MGPKLTDEQLAELFFQQGSTRQLADAQGVDPRDLHRGWQRLKANGMLPKERPRDLYRPGDDDDNREHGFDGRPSVVNAADRDPLLTALIREHAAKTRPPRPGACEKTKQEEF